MEVLFLLVVLLCVCMCACACVCVCVCVCVCARMRAQVMHVAKWNGWLVDELTQIARVSGDLLLFMLFHLHHAYAHKHHP